MKTSDISQILAWTSRWYIQDNNTFIAHDDDDDLERLVTVDELSKKHPLLPIAVREHINWSFAKRCKDYVKVKNVTPEELTYADGGLIRATAELLDCGGISILNRHGETSILSRIDEMKFFQDDLDYVVIAGRAVTVECVSTHTQEIPLVIKSINTELIIDCVCIEAQYPGAKKRFSIASEIGVTHDDMVKYVFSKDVALGTEIQLQDTSFEY